MKNIKNPYGEYKKLSEYFGSQNNIMKEIKS